MVPLLTQLLGLPGVDVDAYEETDDELILWVERHAESATCPRCGRLSTHLHQNHGYLVRDLPISHYRKTWLMVNRRQFKCSECGKPFSEELPFVGGRRKYTDRCAASVLKQVMHSSTKNKDAIAFKPCPRTVPLSKMKLLFKPLPLLCLSIALLLSFLLKPVTASSLIDSRVNQLEFQVRSLQTQISQIQSQSPRPASIPSRPVQTESSFVPGELTLDEQFDNLAILVIELKQRVNALEQQVSQ